MSTSTVNSATGATSNNTTAADLVTPKAQGLTQNDFLKLLVAQMTAQDPLNPTNSQDLLTQTVQLSTLQSNTQLNSALSQMQASSLLGRQVSVQVDSSTSTQGVVAGIDLSSGTPQVVVNGVAYDLKQITSISTPSANP